MTADITSLPPEILVRVFSNLPGKDLANVRRTCVKFREATCVDSIWQNRCKLEYNFTENEGWDSSFFNIYTKVLHKYGSLIGVWQRDLHPYGGFSHIKYDEGRILGVEFHPPDSLHIRRKLVIKDLFSISLSQDGRVQLRCLKGYHGPHPCEIIKKKDGRLKIKCLSWEDHRHPQGKNQELAEWISNNEDAHSHLSVMKFEVFYKNTGKSKLQRMALPEPIRNVPIMPGLFKGHYGAHGIEIMCLNYVHTNGNLEIQVLKITGDPNVPALTVSLFVDLQRPMILNLDQQESMLTLQEIDTPDVLPQGGEVLQIQIQDFLLPTDCYGRDQNVPPKCKFRSPELKAHGDLLRSVFVCPATCSALFHGKGRIAGHGYHDPQLTPGHFMVFDDDTYGFIWMELRSFSMYCRVSEKFD